jgi:malonate-semialdehyde dehydrogenase (acetylating) / methylmalonate-semialdehyde dehydrogenase
MKELTHFIGGAHVKGASGRFLDGFEPMTGRIISRIPMASAEETHAAVANAAAAQSVWAASGPQRRARVLVKFVEVVAREKRSLSELLAREHGKTIADAAAEIQRGVEAIEFAVGAPHLLKGEYSDAAGAGVDIYSMRQPLGVVAGITPFNFPAMIPMWKFGPALACGNAFVLKPSERDPGVPLRLAELMIEAGAPAGILNVIQGDKTAVDALLGDPLVQAIGFVGSTGVAEYVYARASQAGKRAQCFGGAKNHMVVTPDADLDQTTEALVGAAYGSAGERCMAISVVVPVGEATAEALASRLIARIKALKIGASTQEDCDFGPLISAAHLQRVKDYVAIGVEEGAALVVDGRGFKLEGYENGFYLGACLFDKVSPGMRIYREEIFGPVLCILRAADYEEALALVNGHEYANGVAIFTRDGAAARDFSTRVQVGMVGVNVAIPTPLAYHGFGGWKRSFFGDLNQHGPDSFRFYTRTKTVTSKWGAAGKDGGAGFLMPTMS